MYLADDTLILSPSDLNGFVECRHLTQLELARSRGEIQRPPGQDPVAELLSRKGDEHELAYLAKLRADGKDVAEIPDPADRTAAALAESARLTEEAMRSGAEVIYQATFFDAPFRGHADFLERVDRPSDLGDYSYEVADTKLARRAKPYFILQLCFYSELLQKVQGGDPPERIHVILGTGERQAFRLAEFSAYFRQVRGRFLETIEDDAADTYPEPCNHCSVCPWQERCDQQRIDDDHLSLVANAVRRQRDLLNEAGVTTLKQLAELDPATEIAKLNPVQLAKLREQAALQLETRTTGEPGLRLLPPDAKRGFHRLPEPSPGDVFFDMEGDPFFDDGLEYLFGVVTADADEPEFTVYWGRDRAEEKQAFERFVDYVTERRDRWPDLHVYHYAHYELTALRRLAGLHGTREEELDQLMRGEVFVDLYKVVREGMRIGQPSYGLKKVEAFYMDQRETAVTDGNDSVIEFERWIDQGGLDGGDQATLDAIADYNRDDCLSTLWLRNWLLEQRQAAIAEHGIEIDWFKHDPVGKSDAGVETATETAEMIAALCEDVPEDLAEADAEQRARWLLAQVLEYHHREDRPVWWAFFERAGGEAEDFRDDVDCVGYLAQAGAPWPDKKSQIHPMVFPSQETKMRPGSDVHDPVSGDGAGKVVELDVEAGTLALRRGPNLASRPMPAALMPGGPYFTPEQRNALRRLAASVIDAGSVDEATGFRACRDLLLARPPRIAGVAEGEDLYSGAIDLDRFRELVSGLDESYLIVQGPPGSGKTWSGARVITQLMREGKRVGVTSTSHKAIHNMLGAVGEAAKEGGLNFRGLKKASDTNPESEYEDEFVESTTKNGDLLSPDVQLTAGTAWHYAREEVDATLDYLFIDEAGQVSLADALALGTAARNIVLLGDPQQLPQVNQGRHPEGSAASALEHVLRGRQTIPADEGVFLERTFRLHPEICSLVSELMYDGRLRSAEGCERQEILDAGALSGTGVRWAPVEHAGNAQSSIEEAGVIAEMLRELEGTRYLDAEGTEHPLGPDDVLVITPFNAQVRCLEARLPAGTRIGTVDKFQGQEAQVVFFSLATSSGAEVPRSLEFLLSRNRMNVAVSRARCLAVVVASPSLLEIECTTIEQMRLVNALCRIVEVAV